MILAKRAVNAISIKIKDAFGDPSRIRLVFLGIVYILSFLGSGYCALSLTTDTFVKTAISLITFLISIVLWAFLMNFKNMATQIKQKKIEPGIIAVVVMGISVILTMFVNNDSINFISYVGFGLGIANGFLISQLLDWRKAAKHFISIMFYLTVTALLFWLIYAITKTVVLPSLVITSPTKHKYINFFFVAFQNVGSNRLQSIFWEPGLFSTFIILALVFQLYIYKKTPLVQTFTFLFALVLTQSTFGYFALVVFGLLFAYMKIKNRKVVVAIFISVISLFVVFIVFYNPIISFLAKLLPSVFVKMLPGTLGYMSLTTRLISPYLNLQIFIKRPFVGWGIIGADTNYSALINSGEYSSLADAQTSTTTQLLAQFGLFGLIPSILLVLGIIKIKRPAVERLLITTIAILVLNKEPHTGILIDWIIIFLLLKYGFSKTKPALLFDPLDKDSTLNVFYRKDDESIVKRNSILSLFIKGLALVIGFLSAPVYNKYFGGSQKTYGTWLALLSILTWVMTFDLGLGNGLKNRLIENDFLHNREKSKELISSTYLFTSIVGIAFLAIGSILIWTIDISFLFKNANVDLFTLRLSVFFVFVSICLELILKNVLYIFQAMQKQAIASFFSLLTSLCLILFAATVRIPDAKSQLVTCSVFYLFAVNLPLLLATIFVFVFKLKYPPMSIKLAKMSSFKELIGLSLGFFAIQVTLLVINSTNSILISSNYGSEYSALHEYYSKFFVMIYSLFSMITLPYWAMITKLKTEGNSKIIVKMVKQMLIYAAVAAFIGVAILIVLQPIFDVWINDSVDVPIQVNHGIGALFLVNSLMLILISVFTTILNGLSEIRIQIVVFSIGAALKIASFVLLNAITKNSIGWTASIWSSIIALIPIVIVLPIETLKKLKQIKRSQNA